MDEFDDFGYDSPAEKDEGFNEKPDYGNELYETTGVAGKSPKVNRKSTRSFIGSNLRSNNQEANEACAFSANPGIVHFSGWATDKLYEQTIIITNRSRNSVRFQLCPPASKEFSIEYEKLGSLALGMTQKVTVKFIGSEYKYYYDCFSVQGEDSSLVIPIHAYPIVNKVYFPKTLQFGNIPLCEPVVKILSLSCSIPVNFSYQIKVLQSHPYYTVSPTIGVVPAKGSVDIKVVFTPMTLGRCTIKLQLLLGQHGFQPMECEITGRAVSGCIESREMEKAEKRVLDYIINMGNSVNGVLGKESTFRGNLTAKPDFGMSVQEFSGTMSVPENCGLPGTSPVPIQNNKSLDKFAKTKFLLPRDTEANHKNDPVGMMLASSFQSADLDRALDKVIQDGRLIGTKTLTKDKDGRWVGVRAVHGVLKSTLPVRPRGPGSGIVFDAGAQWATLNEAAQVAKRKLTKSKTKGNRGGLTQSVSIDTTSSSQLQRSDGTESETEESKEKEKVVDGIRIPNMLDTVETVNFVLTQEPGKLKPKDLKIAIDKNRAEREARAAEQERMREQGGGAGSLDLMGVLAEEKMNIAGEGDPFKRQLRELAFLADVEEIEKQEIDKEFRVSEEFLGARPLTQTDIETIQRQRQLNALRKKRAEWSRMLGRQHTNLYPPTHTDIKAGAPVVIATQAAGTLKPSFDTNRNDIWSKRMNTLRFFVSMVTRWIVRRRVSTRLAQIKSKIEEVCKSVLLEDQALEATQNATLHGAAKEYATAKRKRALHRAMKERVRAWIEEENTHKSKGGSEASKSVVDGGGGGSVVSSVRKGEDGQENEEGEGAQFSFEQCATVAELVCATDDEAIVRRTKSEQILSTQMIQMTSADTVKRLLFPKCIIEEGNALQPLPAAGIDNVTKFDDRAFFPLKIRPEYITMRYSAHKVPEVPLYFQDGKDRVARIGAAEEFLQRPPADATAKYEDLLSNLPPEPPAIAALRATAIQSHPHDNAGAIVSSNNDTTAVVHGSSSSGSGNALTTHPLLPPSPEVDIAAPSWLLPDESESTPQWPASDIDFFRPRQDLRTYALGPAIRETDPDWILRPYASGPANPDALKYKDDNSVRSLWLSMPGFSSANAYLLGSLESRCTTRPKNRNRGEPVPGLPPPGPTLWDLYRPDNDRHHSGMNCFRRDHLRSLLEADLDFTPLQQRQDRTDVLTDSESDEEDKYEVPPPSLARVRALLGLGSGSAGHTTEGNNNKALPTTSATATHHTDGHEIENKLEGNADDGRAWGEQVELLRDRKMLELESTLLKLRNDRASAFAERLCELSRSSKCLLQAMAVQMPFHSYEEDVRKAFGKVIAPVPTSFVEPTPVADSATTSPIRKKTVAHL